MIEWKPMTKSEQARGEIGYHMDCGLEEGESFDIRIGNEKIKEYAPKGKIWKIHFSMGVEAFDK